eukprot:gene1709-1060_t
MALLRNPRILIIIILFFCFLIPFRMIEMKCALHYMLLAQGRSTMPLLSISLVLLIMSRRRIHIMTHLNEGVVPGGKTFKFPDTMDVMEALSTPNSLRRPGAIIWVGSFLLTWMTTAFYYFGMLPLWFFIAQHLFWRLAYNAGLGCMLKVQSNGRKFETFYKKAIQYKAVKWFLEASVVFHDGSTFRVADYPDEFNAWMLFRQFENVVLANDLTSYMVLSLVCTNFCTLTWSDLPRVVLGVMSVPFSLWSKTDAHRVISEFAWYWGDFFFLVKKDLVFDGIFQMFPHPMYTAGYGFIYGLPLIGNSFTLLWVGIAAHLCQILFLLFVEGPHINKTYCPPPAEPSMEEKQRHALLYDTPAGEPHPYFEQREAVLFLNLSVERKQDLLLLVVAAAQVSLLLLPIPAKFFVWEYVVLKLFSRAGLGFILRRQSKDMWFTKRFSSPRQAFYVWKMAYNFFSSMNAVVFATCVVACLSFTSETFQYVASSVFLVDVSFLIIVFALYAHWSMYDITGVYGHYYADFFVVEDRDGPTRQLSYEGIYRYFNLPEISVGAGLPYAIAILSGSFTILALAALSHATVVIFTLLVDQPHIRRSYQEVRPKGGLAAELEHRAKKRSDSHNQCFGCDSCGGPPGPGVCPLFSFSYQGEAGRKMSLTFYVRWKLMLLPCASDDIVNSVADTSRSRRRQYPACEHDQTSRRLMGRRSGEGAQWSEPLRHRVLDRWEGRARSSSSNTSGASRRHSAVRDDAQTQDEYLRKMRVARCMEEEKERASRTKLLTQEHEKWGRLRVKERAERLQYMTGDEIEALLRREALAQRGPRTPAPASRQHQQHRLPKSAAARGTQAIPASPPPTSAARDTRIVEQERRIAQLELKLAALVACQDEQTSLAARQLERDLVRERQHRQQLEREVEKLHRAPRALPPQSGEAEATVRQLRKEMRRLEQALEDQHRAAQMAQREKEQLQRALEDNRDARRSSADQKRAAALEGKVAELQRKIQESDTTIRQLKSELQGLHDKIRQERQAGAGSGANQDELEAEMADLKRRNKVSDNIIRDLKDEVERLHGELKQERAAAAADKQKLQRDLEAERRKVRAAHVSDDAIRLEELERRQEEMRQMKREDARTIRELREAVRSLEERQSVEEEHRGDVTGPSVGDLQARLAEMRRMKDEDVATIHRLLDERDDLCEALEREKLAARDSAAPAEELEEAKRVMRANEERVSEAEAKIRDLQRRIAELKEERAMVEEEKYGGVLPADAHWIEELQALKQTNKDLSEEAKQARAANVSLSRLVQELQERTIKTPAEGCRSQATPNAAEDPVEGPAEAVEEQRTELQPTPRSAHPPSSHSRQSSHETFPPGTLHAEEVIEPAQRSGAVSRDSRSNGAAFHAEEDSHNREKAFGFNKRDFLYELERGGEDSELLRQMSLVMFANLYLEHRFPPPCPQLVLQPSGAGACGTCRLLNENR